MSYERLNIKNGDIVNDYHINYLQDAIGKISSESKEFKERLAEVLTNKGIVSSSKDTFEDLLLKVDRLPRYTGPKKDPVWPDITETIEPGHIRLLVKTGEEIVFFLQPTVSATFIINWGDESINRYFIPQGGQWIRKRIERLAGTAIDETYSVAIIDISLVTKDSSIARFIAPSEQQSRESILWFCSKNITFTNGYAMFNANTTGEQPCSNLKYIDFIGGGVTGSLAYFAKACSKLERVTGNLNSNGNSAVQAFYNCKSLSQPPILDLTGTLDVGYLFYGCSSITEFDYYINNNGSFTSAYAMFQYCRNLQHFVDGQQFNFSNVTTQEYCFADCNSLITSPEITFGGGSANYFYQNCTSLNHVQNIISANRVTSIRSFFNNCVALVDGPSEFYAPNATNAITLFYNCNSIRTVPSVLNLNNVTEAYQMFENCFNLQKAPITINMPIVKSCYYMFRNCNSLQTPPTTIRADIATTVYSLFESCTTLAKAPSLNFPLATNVGYMFYKCTSLVNGPENIYMPKANDATSFFNGCSMLEVAGTKFEIGNESSNCNFTNFFHSCSSLRDLPRSGNMHTGLNYGSLFENCGNISYEALENFCGRGIEFPNATNAGNLFRGSKIKKVPNVNLPKATATNQMFENNQAFEEIGEVFIPASNNVYDIWYGTGSVLSKIGKITLGTATQNNSNFNNCKKLKELKIDKLSLQWLTLDSASSLTSIRLYNTPATSYAMSLSFQNCALSNTAIDELLNDLPSRSGLDKGTINIKGNPGAGSCTASIGRDKNWNVITV